MEKCSSHKNNNEKEEGELSSDDNADDIQENNIAERSHRDPTAGVYTHRTATFTYDTGMQSPASDDGESNGSWQTSPKEFKRRGYDLYDYESQSFFKYRRTYSPERGTFSVDDAINYTSSSGNEWPAFRDRKVITRNLWQTKNHQRPEKSSRRNAVYNNVARLSFKDRNAAVKASGYRNSRQRSGYRASSMKTFQMPRYEMLADPWRPSIKPDLEYTGLRIKVEDPGWKNVTRKAPKQQVKEESHRSKYGYTNSRYRAPSVEKFQLPRYKISDRWKPSIKSEFHNHGLRIQAEDPSWKEIARKAKNYQLKEESNRSSYASLRYGRVRDHKKDKIRQNYSPETGLYERYPRPSFPESAESTGIRYPSTATKFSSGRMAHNNRNKYTWFKTTTTNPVSEGTSKGQLNENQSKTTDETTSKEKLQVLEKYYKLAERNLKTKEEMKKRRYKIDRTTQIKQQRLNKMNVSALSVNPRNSIHEGKQEINLRDSVLLQIKEETTVGVSSSNSIHEETQEKYLHSGLSQIKKETTGVNSHNSIHAVTQEINLLDSVLSQIKEETTVGVSSHNSIHEGKQEVNQISSGLSQINERTQQINQLGSGLSQISEETTAGVNSHNSIHEGTQAINQLGSGLSQINEETSDVNSAIVLSEPQSELPEQKAEPSAYQQVHIKELCKTQEQHDMMISEQQENCYKEASCTRITNSSAVDLREDSTRQASVKISTENHDQIHLVSFAENQEYCNKDVCAVEITERMNESRLMGSVVNLQNDCNSQACADEINEVCNKIHVMIPTALQRDYTKEASHVENTESSNEIHVMIPTVTQRDYTKEASHVENTESSNEIHVMIPAVTQRDYTKEASHVENTESSNEIHVLESAEELVEACNKQSYVKGITQKHVESHVMSPGEAQ